MCSSRWCEYMCGTTLSHPSHGKHHLEDTESAIYLLSDSEEMQPQDLTLTPEQTQKYIHISIYSHRRNKPMPVETLDWDMQGMHEVKSQGHA